MYINSSKILFSLLPLYSYLYELKFLLNFINQLRKWQANSLTAFYTSNVVWELLGWQGKEIIF